MTIHVPIEIDLTFEDQEKLKKVYVLYGDGLDFMSFCKKFFKQELRWALDNGWPDADEEWPLFDLDKVKKSVSETMQDELEPIIFHSTEHDESDDIEQAKRFDPANKISCGGTPEGWIPEEEFKKEK